MILPIQLISNYNQALCLYCHWATDVLYSSEYNQIISSNIDWLNKASIYCSSCKEIFEVYYSQITDFGNAINESSVLAFFFSCGGKSIFYRCAEDHFLIMDNIPLDWNTIIHSAIKIPKFTIDFSNKEKLHNKILTYLTFS